MKSSCSVSCVICAAAAFFLGIQMLPSAQAPNSQKIKVLTLLGRPLQVVVAETQDIFAKYGVEVETENLPNSEAVRANLAAGKGDLAYLAVDNAVAMVEIAHQDVIIVMGGEGSQNELIVQPEIKSIKDFRWKTLIVDAPNTAYALQMKKILLLNGMQAGKDYQIKPFGVTAQRLIAMREHKEFAGSMLGPPTSIVAKHDGFVSVGSVQELIGPYQAAGYSALRGWAKEHRATLVNYLAAIVEAQRWLMAPANKHQVIELWVKENHLAPEVAAETYESRMKSPGRIRAGCALGSGGIQKYFETARGGGRLVGRASAGAGKILRPFVLRRSARKVERDKVNEFEKETAPYRFFAVADCSFIRVRECGRGATTRTDTRGNKNGSDQARGKWHASADRTRSRVRARQCFERS